MPYFNLKNISSQCFVIISPNAILPLTKLLNANHLLTKQPIVHKKMLHSDFNDPSLNENTTITFECPEDAITYSLYSNQNSHIIQEGLTLAQMKIDASQKLLNGTSHVQFSITQHEAHAIKDMLRNTDPFTKSLLQPHGRVTLAVTTTKLNDLTFDMRKPLLKWAPGEGLKEVSNLDIEPDPKLKSSVVLR